jgi:hypothetical protein
MQQHTAINLVEKIVVFALELTPQHPQLLSERGTEQETEVAHYRQGYYDSN